MGFFDELEKNLEKRLGDAGQVLSSAGQDMSRQAKSFAEIAKVKGLIAEQEKLVRESYEELGKAYFEMHSDDRNAEGQEVFERIRGAKATIGQLQSKVYKMKGVKGCPCCGKENALDAIYCNQCGTKLPEEPAEEEESEGGLQAADEEDFLDEAEEEAIDAAVAEEIAEEVTLAAAEEVADAIDDITAAADEIAEAVIADGGSAAVAEEIAQEIVTEAVEEVADTVTQTLFNL